MIAFMQRALTGNAALGIRELLSQPRSQLTLRLTLLLLILHGATSWVLDVPLRILCGILILSPVLLMSSLLWLGVAGALIWVHAEDWFSIDNHKYLITYWGIVCALAVTSRTPDRVLSANGRILIGLCFTFAVAWKFLGGGFLDGSFLHYTLLKDSRIESIAVGVGGLDRIDLAQNRELMRTLRSLPADQLSIQLKSTDATRWAALGLSYWTLFIEGFVALAFLVRSQSRVGRLRDVALMTFIATTYFILPVTGFAFMLALLGFSQCEVEQSRTRIAYLFLFLAIQLTRVPWDDFVASWVD